MVVIFYLTLGLNKAKLLLGENIMKKPFFFLNSKVPQHPGQLILVDSVSDVVMREHESISEESRARKHVREQLECDTCGQLSRLHEGMCQECLDKYQPKDFA